MKSTTPFSGRGTTIYYEDHDNGFNVKWGTIKFFISGSLIKDILENFLIDKNKWYPLGASETDPMPKGLGSFVNSKSRKLNPRHASAITAIMYEEKLIEAEGKRPILLKKK